jgi:glutaminase
VYKSEE